MRRVLGLALAGALLASSAVASPGHGGDKQQPIGAAARAKHGPDPMAKPPEDVGAAEDPVTPVGQPAAVKADQQTPAGAAAAKPTPRSSGSPQ